MGTLSRRRSSTTATDLMGALPEAQAIARFSSPDGPELLLAEVERSIASLTDRIGMVARTQLRLAPRTKREELAMVACARDLADLTGKYRGAVRRHAVVLALAPLFRLDLPSDVHGETFGTGFLVGGLCLIGAFFDASDLRFESVDELIERPDLRGPRPPVDEPLWTLPESNWYIEMEAVALGDGARYIALALTSNAEIHRAAAGIAFPSSLMGHIAGRRPDDDGDVHAAGSGTGGVLFGMSTTHVGGTDQLMMVDSGRSWARGTRLGFWVSLTVRRHPGRTSITFRPTSGIEELVLYCDAKWQDMHSYKTEVRNGAGHIVGEAHFTPPYDPDAAQAGSIERDVTALLCDGCTVTFWCE